MNQVIENNVESVIILLGTAGGWRMVHLSIISASALLSQSPVFSTFPKSTARGSTAGPIDQEAPTRRPPGEFFYTFFGIF